jgi:hypothetical protein
MDAGEVASALLDDATTSSSSRSLASDPAALVAPSHTCFSNLLDKMYRLPPAVHFRTPAVR